MPLHHTVLYPSFPVFSSSAGNGLKLRFRPYHLQLKHRFTLAHSSRATTPVVLTELEFDGTIGYGEAALPPYLGESQESVITFLSKLDLTQFKNPGQLEEILEYVDHAAPENTAAKASVDIALHDLLGKLLGKPWHELWGLNPANAPDTSLTIGIDNPAVIKQKVREATGFNLLKVKLGSGDDQAIIKSIREVTDVPLSVDANQGWNDKQEALEMIHWLKEQGVVLVEQPMAKSALDDMAWLTQQSPLPTFADEAVQRLPDIQTIHQAYSGINIKLMKCTGLFEASKMITKARSLGMQVMIGCMTETSCAVSAAAQLSPSADWADLDGNLLISNDVFEGVKITDGKIHLNDQAGIGIRPA